MGASGRDFMQMREEEMQQVDKFMHFPQMTKKDIQANAKHHGVKIFADGEKDTFKELANVARAKEYLTIYEKALREGVLEELNGDELKAHGMEFSVKNGSSRLNYKEDPIWQSIKNDLTAREELLKTANKSKTPIYDEEGIEIPRVSKSGGGSVLNIKF